MSELTDPGALIFVSAPISFSLYAAGWALLLSVIDHHRQQRKGRR